MIACLALEKEESVCSTFAGSIEHFNFPDIFPKFCVIYSIFFSFSCTGLQHFSVPVLPVPPKETLHKRVRRNSTSSLQTDPSYKPPHTPVMADSDPPQLRQGRKGAQKAPKPAEISILTDTREASPSASGGRQVAQPTVVTMDVMSAMMSQVMGAFGDMIRTVKDKDIDMQREVLEREERLKEEALEREEKRWQEAQEREEERKEKDAERRTAEAEHQERKRFRNQVMAGLPHYKDGEDLEGYLEMIEGSYRRVRLPEDEWSFHVRGKLSGKASSYWMEITETVLDYGEAKSRLLTHMGYTPKRAAMAFFSTTQNDIRGMDADELVARGKMLVKRMCAPDTVTGVMLYKIVRWWVYCLVPKKARAFIDTRRVDSLLELGDVLRDYVGIEGSFREFSRPQGSGSNNKPRVEAKEVVCYSCREPGHKAPDCPNKSKERSGSSGSSSRVVVCYNCQEEGHKANECEYKKTNVKKVKAEPKPVKKVWCNAKKEHVLEGEVNGSKINMLLDTGAGISVVPRSLVPESDIREKEKEHIKPYGAKTPFHWPTAIVAFKVEELEWDERVVVAPHDPEDDSEVIYAVDLRSDFHTGLLALYNSRENEKRVNVVKTRSMTREEGKEAQQDAVEVAVEQPKVTQILEPVAESVPPESPGSASLDASEYISPTQFSHTSEYKDSDTSSVSSLTVVAQKEGEQVLVEGEEAVEFGHLGDWAEPSEAGEEEYTVRKVGSGKDGDLDLPVLVGGGDRARLVSETKLDPSLEAVRGMADRHEKGYSWCDGLIMLAVEGDARQTEHVIVLPKSLRARVLMLAHDKMGHLGSKKVKEIVRRNFSWPHISGDIIHYCKSCEVCQRMDKSQPCKVPLVERQIMTEPHETLAFDLVGPFPPAKGGYRWILTCLDQATKWPEAIPVKSITARTIAREMMGLFARTGIPREILTDQGSQFIGSMVSKLCQGLGIDKLKTTPYRPESNGLVERMHKTLNSVLRKCAAEGKDWVAQLPFALFALRAAPNRDTHFSPFELLYGRSMRSPLELLYEGWVDKDLWEMDVGSYSETLIEKLEVMRDVQRERMLKASKDRKQYFDKKAVRRVLTAGDLVLVRKPGLSSKLEESWHGPYKVLEKLNDVNYRIAVGRKKKVLHVNNMKLYVEREVEVLRMVVVGSMEVDEEKLKLGGRVQERSEWYVAKDIEQLKAEFPKVFSSKPGKATVAKMTIDLEEGTRPHRLHPYRIPEKLKQGVRGEIEKIVNDGYAVPSKSPWASPIVPVPKLDGSVRICVDFRRLNASTIGDPYYMSTLDEILEKVGQSSVVSKIDLAKGFYQIPLDESAIDKTAFVTPFGKYAFTRMPFGLRNAPAAFQRTMEEVLGHLEHCAPYIDDVIIFSSSWEEHLFDLKQVLKALEGKGLTVKTEKCAFGMK